MSTGALKAAVIGGIAGAVMVVGTVAVAGTGIGGVFNLGVDNSVDGQTLLHGNTSGNPQLRVNNQQGTDAAVGVFGTQGKTGPGVYGNSTSGYGVWGIGSYGLVGGGSQGGVWGSSASGSGVYGVHSAATGTSAGVFGETNSASQNATGILAKANATNAGRDNVALRAINANTNQYGMGVWGSIAGSGWGVLGESGANGIGVIGKLGGTGTGVQGQTGAGGVGVRGIGGKTGVYGQANDSGGYAFAAQGDAGQNRGSGGWVKAMAYVDPSQPAGQQVVRCFNSQVAPNTPNCGITATGFELGRWSIDFGFQVSDRFLMVTPRPAGDQTIGNACADNGCLGVNTATQAEVVISYAGTGATTNAAFWILVF